MGFSSTKIRTTQIIITLILLASCTNTDDLSVDDSSSSNTRYQYENDEWGLSLSIPEHFASTLDDEGVFFGYGPTYGDFFIQIYQPASPPSCSSNAIGINSPITLNDSKDENTIWGRMDYGEIYYTGDFPQEFTKPCSYSGENVYAFCSEKVGDPAKAVDDKRVVICINQQTDDAKLAEEIFKTFKWIK